MITIAFWLFVLSAGLCLYRVWLRSRLGEPYVHLLFTFAVIVAMLIGLYMYMNAH